MTTDLNSTHLRISADDLHAAASAGVIQPTQVDPLLGFLRTRATAMSGQPSRFDMVHLLWYAGALVVMGAMGLFSTLAFSQMGGMALAATAIVYALAFGLAGDHLWRRRGLRTPGGLMIAVAVTMAPLAVYGVQDAMGLLDTTRPQHRFGVWNGGSWIWMELATVAAASLALRVYRFPFLVMPLAIALWFLAMDIVPWLTGQPRQHWEISRVVSIWFGLAMIVAAIAVNLRQRSGDFAFWLYLFGVLAFWGGITASSDSTALTRALYCAMNIGLLLVSVLLARQVFAVAGAIGVALYLGELADRTFRDSLLFPFVLSLIGVAVIGLGLYIHRRRDAIDAWLTPRLPPVLQQLRERA